MGEDMQAFEMGIYKFFQINNFFNFKYLDLYFKYFCADAAGVAAAGVAADAAGVATASSGGRCCIL